ncbi:MAG TPA: SDR family NAD(P)-dependent oxidoreductase [Gammaproteobacteria bacterium]
MFREKTIVVTGANRGIGFEAVKQLAASGHTVVLTARDEVKGKAAADILEGDVIVHQLDVTDERSIRRFTDFVQDELMAVDVLINNAGSSFDKRSEQTAGNPLYTSVEMLRKTLEVNLVGAYALTRELLPYITRENRADIINVSSGMGALTDMGTGSPAYRISKAALNALTVFLHAELSSNTQIHVNSICPGWVRTALGGANASRSLEEGVQGILWIVNEEPELSGKFIRDRSTIDF